MDAAVGLRSGGEWMADGAECAAPVGAVVAMTSGWLVASGGKQQVVCSKESVRECAGLRVNAAEQSVICSRAASVRERGSTPRIRAQLLGGRCSDRARAQSRR